MRLGGASPPFLGDLMQSLSDNYAYTTDFARVFNTRVDTESIVVEQVWTNNSIASGACGEITITKALTGQAGIVSYPFAAYAVALPYKYCF